MPRHPLPEVPYFPDLSAETALWERGLQWLAGLDEAGRGAWAGPVSAGAVILPADVRILEELQGVRDSKQMTARQRSAHVQAIHTYALAWGVGFASAAEIDEIGIVPATRLAMQRALQQCGLIPEHLLVDALRLPQIAIPQTALIKGDARSLSIAAASVLAKTSRDAWMVALGEDYPAFHFGAHKGYGTAAHRAALQTCGPCPQHRFSFRPVRAVQEALSAQA